jgi:hypothetical protein
MRQEKIDFLILVRIYLIWIRFRWAKTGWLNIEFIRLILNISLKLNSSRKFNQFGIDVFSPFFSKNDSTYKKKSLTTK